MKLLPLYASMMPDWCNHMMIEIITVLKFALVIVYIKFAFWNINRKIQKNENNQKLKVV